MAYVLAFSSAERVMMYRSRSFVLIAMDSSGSKGFSCPRVNLWKVIVDVPIFPFSYTGLSKIVGSSSAP